MSKELNPKLIYTPEEIVEITDEFSKKDVINILGQELDITIVDWENMSIKQIIETGLEMFKSRFVEFDKYKKGKVGK